MAEVGEGIRSNAECAGGERMGLEGTGCGAYCRTESTSCRRATYDDGGEREVIEEVEAVLSAL